MDKNQTVLLLRLSRENARKVFANRGSWEVIDELANELLSAELGVRQSDFDWSELDPIKQCLTGQPLFGDDQRSAELVRPDLVPHFRAELQNLSEAPNFAWLIDLYEKAAASGDAVLIVKEA